MYRVSTVHLSADATRVDLTADAVDLGELSAGELVRLLERFQTLGALEPDEAEPYVDILGRAGKFHVRTGRGRLFLYNARDTIEPYAELTPAEIIVQLDRDSLTGAPFILPPEGPTGRPKRNSTAPQRGIAAAILATGLLLNAYTVYSVSYAETVNPKSDVKLLTDAKEITSRQSEMAGAYATGDRPGDRVITIQTGGRVEFSEVGRRSSVTDFSDTYKIGRRGGKICLLTGDGSVIEIKNIETVLYFRDTYRRR